MMYFYLMTHHSSRLAHLLHHWHLDAEHLLHAYELVTHILHLAHVIR